MSAQDIIDLDALVPQDKKVTFGGVVYEVPGDMPMETFLKLQNAGDADDETAIFDQLVATMMELFAYKLPTMGEEAEQRRAKLEKDLRKLGIRTFMGMFKHIYGEDPEDPKEPDPTVPQPSPGAEEDGTTKTNAESQTEVPTPPPASPA